MTEEPAVPEKVPEKPEKARLSTLLTFAWVDPTTREKFKRFRKQRRAWISFWLLSLIFVLSLFSEQLANGTPRRIHFEGQTYRPRRQNVPEDLFYGNGVLTPPDFRELAKSELFLDHPENRIVWAPIPYGPEETVRAENVETGTEDVTVTRRRVQRVGIVNVDDALNVINGSDASWFFGVDTDAEVAGLPLPDEVASVVRARFENRESPARTVLDAEGGFAWSVSAFTPRARPPRRVRVTLREQYISTGEYMDVFVIPLEEAPRFPVWWQRLPEDLQAQGLVLAEDARHVPVRPIRYDEPDGHAWRISIEFDSVQFPFRPVPGHPLGFDDSGRDVLVQILYATRISLLFGFILVFSSMMIGTLMGALQGYFGGVLDLITQRLIEIYQSVPFLYVMIFVGAVFGRSFWLLLFVYAMFNWIGISYYMRAEFLRLRGQPFTEAARALGLPTGRIMLRHLLPNAMVPLITFFPFMLVGAIGSLSSLDYLGFGLPAGTPSWGTLLRQAQAARHAWWLVAYPSLALFVVILLSVFVGEGLRTAFDPKREAHWEA